MVHLNYVHHKYSMEFECDLWKKYPLEFMSHDKIFQFYSFTIIGDKSICIITEYNKYIISLSIGSKFIIYSLKMETKAFQRYDLS